MSSRFLGDFVHKQAAAAIAATAPTSIRDILAQIIDLARNSNIPWLKIFMALATAAAGGFSPAAIAAAIAQLFGANVPTQLASHVGATSTAPAI